MPEAEAEWTALFRAANGGDRVAYARFLKQTTPVLRGITRVRRRSVPAQQHEDILQEALLATHARRDTWDPARLLRPCLQAISRHKVTDAFRARGSRVELTFRRGELPISCACPPEQADRCARAPASPRRGGGLSGRETGAGE